MTPRSRIRRAVRGLYAATALLVGGWLLIGSIPSLRRDITYPYANDGSTDWHGARAFWAGANPYTPDYLRSAGLPYYGHPPTTAFWFLPLARLDLATMKFGLDVIVLLLLFVHIWVAVRELALPAPQATAALVFGATVATTWWHYHLKVGQISELVAFFYLLAWYWLRRDRDVPAGAALGAACTLKFFPGVMVLLLLVARRWRAVVAACAAFGIVALVMTVRYGVGSWADFFAQQPKIADYWLNDVQNASLHGIVARLFFPICEGRHAVGALPTAIALVASALLLALAVWLTRRSLRTSRSLDVPFSIFAILSCFLNVWVWEHYDVLLIVPILVAAVALWRARAAGLGWFPFAAGAATLCGAVAMLGVDIHAKGRFLPPVVRAVAPSHPGLHVYEIVNWLPWILVLAILCGLSYWSAGRAVDLVPAPPAPETDRTVAEVSERAPAPAT